MSKPTPEPMHTVDYINKAIDDLTRVRLNYKTLEANAEYLVKREEALQAKLDTLTEACKKAHNYIYFNRDILQGLDMESALKTLKDAVEGGASNE